MGMREDRVRAMLFERPERIPISASVLPAAWMRHRDALAEVVRRHPALFGEGAVPADFDRLDRSTYAPGRHVDAWGCVWSNVHAGMEAMVTGHPYPTRESVRSVRLPDEDIGFPHGFMYLRLADLRGFEELMADLAEEPPELDLLIDAVLRYNMRQAHLRLADMYRRGERASIVHFGDDLGMQRSLPMSPATWRRRMKPCFTGIFRPFRAAGHYVYLHTDGHVLGIVPDLVDSGVNVLNLQVRANGLDGLRETCRGRTCVDLDLDRQLFPFATPDAIDAHVAECVSALSTPAGGLWLKAEIGEDVPLEVAEALFAAMERHGGWG